MTLAFQQCHLQVCLWREETEAMPHSRLWLCHQRSTHCVPATTTPGFFLDLTFSANSFLLCETCFFLNLWCVLGRPLWPALCTIRKGLVEAVASNLMLCSVRTCRWTAWMYGSLHVPHLYGQIGAAEDGPEEGHGGHGAERASSTTATPVFTASWDEDASNGKSGTASSSDTKISHHTDTSFNVLVARESSTVSGSATPSGSWARKEKILFLCYII